MNIALSKSKNNSEKIKWKKWENLKIKIQWHPFSPRKRDCKPRRKTWKEQEKFWINREFLYVFDQWVSKMKKLRKDDIHFHYAHIVEPKK